MNSNIYITNIKEDNPVVPEAIKRLDYEIRRARTQKYNLLKVIHGYGSTGKGGKIRGAVYRRLDFLKLNNLINDYIKGSDWQIFDHKVQDLVKAGFDITIDEDMNNHNSGITVVILSK